MGTMKTAEKTDTVEQPHGGRLLRGGQLGNKGGTGRPPNEFRQKLKELRDRPSVAKYLQRCLEGKEGAKAYMAALQFTDERVDGKVPNVTKVEGGDVPLKLLVVGSVDELPKGE